MCCLDCYLAVWNQYSWLVVPVWKEKGAIRTATTTGVSLLSVPGKSFAHLLLMWICSYMLQLQRTEQSGFRSCYVYMWHICHNSTLPTRLFQEDSPEWRRPLRCPQCSCFGNLMYTAGTYWECERGLHRLVHKNPTEWWCRVCEAMGSLAFSLNYLFALMKAERCIVVQWSYSYLFVYSFKAALHYY